MVEIPESLNRTFGDFSISFYPFYLYNFSIFLETNDDKNSLWG